MDKLDLYYFGQFSDAKAYLSKRDEFDEVSVEGMKSEEIEYHIEEIMKKEDLVLVFQDNEQDIGLMPRSLEKEISWFRR